MPKQKRELMVRDQIAARGVSDSRVLAAMRSVPREKFVPPELVSSAYEDGPLPIGHEQTISQPYIVAYMIEALKLTPESRVLEIGTGSGYQTAILCELVKKVYSIEVIPELAVQAIERLNALGYSNLEVKHGDGYAGWTEHAPYDAVIIAAAPEDTPYELLSQLKPGGRMIVPVGSFVQELVLITRTADGYDTQRLLSVRFVPMVHPEKNR
ncbi:MAG: protein-L-isoaspartate(D-aspartate) O-methyltransferase [Spirochaetes bacterium]|nr:protein-L-isoaspartate(D-aspartate) O-methyltransferase [Spirochaetota bacterium]